MMAAHEPIGLIGIGLLGGAVADRLIDAGFEVIGFDRDAARRDELERRGGRAVSAAPEVARDCRRILLSLPDSSAVASVVSQIRPQLSPGAIIVDTTTGDPTETAQVGNDLAAGGVGYVDATIAGSSQQVRGAEVVVMAGGEAAHVSACRDLFDTFARRTFHVGPCGSGARMKLVVNLILGLHRAVLAEGLAFARACGVDLKQALEVLKTSPANSGVMDTKGEKMRTGDFTPQARLRQHLKDVRLILTAAEQQKVALPLSSLHAELLQSLVDRGFGEEDNSAIIRAFERADLTEEAS